MAAFSIHGDIIWTENPDSFKAVRNGYLIVENGKVKAVSAEKGEGRERLLERILETLQT